MPEEIVTTVSRSGGLISFLNSTRLISTACGVVVLVGLAFTRDDAQTRLALTALVALGFATLLGWSQILLNSGRGLISLQRVNNRSRRLWWITAIGVAVVAGAAAQSWFRPGTVIAGGDAGPPVGTAWLRSLFEPWVWGGSNLGQPSEVALQLPWAAALGAVHLAGSDAELAQRIWYTVLFIGAGLGGFGLMAALGLRPVGAVIGATVYLFNPYVVSVIGTNPVGIAALVLVAAIPAVLLAVGTRQLAARSGIALVALAAPMFGYVYFSPPLLGMVLVGIVATPLVAGWVHGREVAFRSLRTLGIAAPLLAAASLYWIVAGVLFLSVVPKEQLADVLSWSWTESRATLANAFWLNTTWAWAFPEYFTFRGVYDTLPVSLLKFILPAIAFSALALGRLGHGALGFVERDKALRLAVAAATVAIFLIFLSTGTNPPGSVAFDFLYRLPLGWLLREPGRFLMVVGLAFGVLLGVVVDQMWSSPLPFSEQLRQRLTLVFRGSTTLLAFGTALCVGFPLFTGSVVPDTRPLLPSNHVKVPGYWTEMAHRVDALPARGSVLIMPPDDFYQMPYEWGYYGTDNFIVDLFHRPVLVPSSQGYLPASSELASAVNLTAQSILGHDWRQTEALVRAMDAPLILVRRDIDPTFAGRVIMPPNDLVAALTTAPNFKLISTVGSLDLFELAGVTTQDERISTPVTIESSTPDLRLLSLLNSEMALVSSRNQRGMPFALQAPPLETWQQNSGDLLWRTSAPGNWDYRIADLHSGKVVSIGHPGKLVLGDSGAGVAYASDEMASSVTVSVPGRLAISDGDFATGLWASMRDCKGGPTGAKPRLGAQVLPGGAPGGLPALRLSTAAGAGCVNQRLNWHGGHLVVTLMTHTVKGSPPHLCLWETGPERCASIPSIRQVAGWSTYRALAIPDSGTTAIDAFLFADPNSTRNVNEFANVNIIDVSPVPDFGLLATPIGQSSSPKQLIVLHSTYSPFWTAGTGEHVIVDGMLNGWLVKPGTQPPAFSYRPASVVRVAQWLSAVAWLIALAILVWPRFGWLARQQSRGMPPRFPARADQQAVGKSPSDGNFR